MQQGMTATHQLDSQQPSVTAQKYSRHSHHLHSREQRVGIVSRLKTQKAQQNLLSGEPRTAIVSI